MLNCNKELQAFAYRQHKIKVFLAGDYEFQSTSYGLSGASGNPGENLSVYTRIHAHICVEWRLFACL